MKRVVYIVSAVTQGSRHLQKGMKSPLSGIETTCLIKRGHKELITSKILLNACEDREDLLLPDETGEENILQQY